MAYLPDDLFEQLRAELPNLMSLPNDKTFSVECSFCDRRGDYSADIHHRDDCLGVRLLLSMDAEQRGQLGSG